MAADSPAMGDFGKEVVVVVPRKPDQEGPFINELKAAGFEVILVTSPQKILRLRENKPKIWVPAMIIVEAILPDCSAYELTRKVSEQWADVKVPLLMMSEFVSSEDERSCRSHCSNHCSPWVFKSCLPLDSRGTSN